MRKADRRLESFADVDMLGKLVAIIYRHGFDLFLYGRSKLIKASATTSLCLEGNRTMQVQ